jgi:transcriptional regulator NrdR family protein
MSQRVIKKDGRKEDFIQEKIVVSALKTGASADVARTIADKIQKETNKEISTTKIRESVLHELHKHNPEWSKRWISYDKGVKRLYKHMY